MKNYQKLIMMLAVSLISASSLAQGFYLGADIGRAKYDIDSSCLGPVDSDISPLLAESRLNTTKGQECENKKTSWQLNVGYQFSPRWAVEANYAEFGRLSGKAQNTFVCPDGAQCVDVLTASENISTKTNTKGYGLALVGFYPIGNTSLFAKVGAFHWDIDVKANFTCMDTACDVPNHRRLTKKINDTRAMFGLGADIAVTDKVSIRLEWRHYDNKKADFFDDLEQVSAGVVYRFF